jgi:hypothetical protein
VVLESEREEEAYEQEEAQKDTEQNIHEGHSHEHGLEEVKSFDSLHSRRR